MTHHDDDNNVPDLSIKEMLKLIMQEIVDVRKELKEDIANLDQKLTKRIDSVAADVHQVKSDLKGLRMQVHQNHTAFITVQEDHGKRIAVLESAA